MATSDYPEYVRIKGKEYKINSDFRVAIKCNEIAMNKNINDIERALAIIYLLFGKEGLDDEENYDLLLKSALIFLSCGEDKQKNKNSKPDMDYVEDKKYIKSSFKYDYHYDPYSMEYLHWYDFFNDLNNLSNDEFGTCCILNRIRNLRNRNPKEIKDPKERQALIDAQKEVALKRFQNEKIATNKQKESAINLLKQLGIKKEEIK